MTDIHYNLNIKNRLFCLFGFFLGLQVSQIFENKDSFIAGLIKLHSLQVNS